MPSAVGVVRVCSPGAGAVRADDPCLRQKGPADPLTTCSAREDPGRMIVILRRQLAPKRPQQLRTALNVAGGLEQTLTPFRGSEPGAPDLLQTRSTDRPIWTQSRSIKDR